MMRERLFSCYIWLGNDRHARTVLLGLLTLAFLVRLATAWVIPIDYRLRDDAVEYVSDARHLLTRGVFGEEPGVPYATIPPGYPFFIAAIFALTNQSLMAVRLAQVFLGTLVVWLTYLIGREAASKQVGLLGAFISALYPAWIIWTAMFMTETLYTTLLLAFTLCLVRSLQRYTAKQTVLTGAMFGLALLTREVLFVFPLLLPVALWWSRISWRHAWRYLLLFTIAALLTLSPWLARNYHTFGQVFYTERTEAIRYQLTGSGYLAPAYQYLADGSAPPAVEKYPGYYERYGAPGELTSVTFVLANPTTYLLILVNRFVEIWLHPNGLQSLPDNLMVKAVYIALHICMLGVAGVGVVRGLRYREAVTRVSSLLLAYVTVMFLFFTAPNPRYTLPFLPLIFILSALGLGSVWQYLRRRGAIDVSITRRV